MDPRRQTLVLIVPPRRCPAAGASHDSPARGTLKRPRGTSTLSNGRVYSFGATGILNALDSADGAVVWSRNVAADADAKVPYWGFASSPLVVGDTVIVAAAGRLVAYDLAAGEPRWLGPAHRGSYSSPHLLTLDGVAQVLLLKGGGATGVALAHGALLWEHSWQPGASIVQPALTADGDILITAADEMGGVGMRRMAVAHGPTGWTIEERWTSRGLKPYFNDFVVHEGHAFGFDNSILACIDLRACLISSFRAAPVRKRSAQDTPKNRSLTRLSE